MTSLGICHRGEQPLLMLHQTLAAPLFERHFTGELGRQRTTSGSTKDTAVCAAHNAAAAIRQII